MQPDAAPPPPPPRAVPTGRAVPGDGVDLYARDWGGDGRAVVLLHGLGSNARVWDAVAGGLAVAGWRAVALDQRGHGDAGQPADGYGVAEFVADLAAACAALGLDRPLLAGHGWGGNVAVQYAVERPAAVAGLVLADGGWTDPANAMTWAEAERRLVGTPLELPPGRWEAAAVAALPPGVDARAPWVQAYLRAGAVVGADGLARPRLTFDHRRRILRALYDQRVSRLLPRVRCPVLLCPAERGQDWAKRAVVAATAGALGNTRVSWFQDSAHDLPLQRSEALTTAIDEFAKEIGLG